MGRTEHSQRGLIFPLPSLPSNESPRPSKGRRGMDACTSQAQGARDRGSHAHRTAWPVPGQLGLSCTVPHLGGSWAVKIPPIVPQSFDPILLGSQPGPARVTGAEAAFPPLLSATPGEPPDPEPWTPLGMEWMPSKCWWRSPRFLARWPVAGPSRRESVFSLRTSLLSKLHGWA